MAASFQQLAQWISAAHQANARGDHAAAARWCEQATRAAPQVPEGWFNLAVALHGLGRRADAVRAAKKAAELTGDAADAQNSIGLQLLELDAVPDARRCFERAIALAPHHPFAYCNLGKLQERQRRYEEAEASFRRAVELQPDLAPAHANLCGILNARHDHEAAEAAGRRAVDLDPRSPAAWANLGSALSQLGRYEAAETACRKAIGIAPDSAEAWTNLGLALTGLGQFDTAGPACRRAIELNPRSPEAWRNLSAVLWALGKNEPAEAALRKALELDPEFAAGWSHLAEMLVRRFELRDAEAACRRAISLDARSAAPHAVLATVHVQRWDSAQAAAEYRRALDKDPHDLNILSRRLFTLNYAPEAAPGEMLTAALEYDRAAHRNVRPFASWACDVDPERRLRVGLVSGDFYRHPVGFLLKGPVRELRKAELELYAYSSNRIEDDVTAELKPHCAAWRKVVGLGDAELAERIHGDRIDILVDPSGHTEHGRLGVFAWRPAPVQVTWLGYFATTGLREIDWKIGDPWVTPATEEHHFTERVWRLPQSVYCFAPPPGAPGVAGLPSLAGGAVTYGCFNNLTKVNDEVVGVWSRVLRADPAAKLLLKAKQLASGELLTALLARFERHGIAADRLLLEEAGRYVQYLEGYARVDVALDPFPYTGGATTAEALWMGVPVLTLAGDRYIGHQGESILHAAGLSEWIAVDEDEYVSKALRFAADRAALARVRAGLRDRLASSPLFDAPRYCRDLEAAWRGMWRQWCGAQGDGRPSAP